MKWALVTGAASGLGKEIARTLAQQGKNIVIHYRTQSHEAEMLSQELNKQGVNAETIQGDFSTIATTRDFLERYLSRFSHTSLLINNVGNYLLGSASQTSPEELLTLFQTNVNAPLMCINALLPALKDAQGAIINIGMAGAHLSSANTHATAYNLTKQSLAMLTRSLAKELAPSHVTVNMVSPGYLERSIDLPQHSDLIPMGRLGRFHEVADTVCFLSSQPYITGQIIEVAGGTRL